MSKTFFFYDLETSGLDARSDRIMQFAGQRTDMGLKAVGEPVNLLVKLGDDVLPSPYAICVTGITPQMTLADGITEAELCRELQEKVFTPDTIAVGFNTVRFDDEFMRYTWWRNFWDPYEFEWKDGRSRWDLLDLVRMTRGLRPEGIKWPVDKEGKATNRLELITKLNGISHEAAHDALSDVEASIDVARLIREKQPQLFEYLLKMRDKKEVAKLVNLDEKREFVYTSGRYEEKFGKTTVAFPLTTGKNGNVVVYDLRYDPSELVGLDKKELQGMIFPKWEKDAKEKRVPVVKELAYNKCPAVAPLGVLEQSDGWGKIGLDKETVARNKKLLLENPDFAEKVRTLFEDRGEFAKNSEVEGQLYDGFVEGADKMRCELVRNADDGALADFNPDFADERLPELLLHYKARNYPKSLSSDEAMKWEMWRAARVEAQMPSYVEALEKLSERDGAKNKFVVEELQYWIENVAPSDY